MFEFSIEGQVEKIVDPRTKIYFREVLQTYVNGNLRSSMVMLWTVVVCDMVFKLKHLHEVQADPTSERLLKEIEDKQKENPTSPDWEAYLLDEIKKRTTLLSSAEHSDLKNIHAKRHLSAHPILTEADLLLEPTPEIVRAYIRAALEALLTKPPFLTKNIVAQLATDIAEIKHLFPDDKGFRKYLEAKYYGRLSTESQNHLFTGLWKFVFKLENSEANENREINFRALKLLYNKNKDQFKSHIANHSDRFSDLSFGNPINYIFLLLSDDPSLFHCLTDAAKEPIHRIAQSSLDKFTIAFFSDDNIEDHLESVLKKVKENSSIDGADGVTSENWKIFRRICDDNGNLEKANEIAIELYARSMNYNTGDVFFERYIEPKAGEFSEREMIKIITDTERNSQVTGRGSAGGDHRGLLEKNIHVVSDSFDWSNHDRWNNTKMRIKS